MHGVLSKREKDIESPYVHLNAIWYVNANATYKAHSNGAPASRYVAVRTLSGRGSLTLKNGMDFSLSVGGLSIFEEKEIVHYAAAQCGWQFYWFKFSAEDWILPLLNQTSTLPISAPECSELERCFFLLKQGSLWETAAAEALFVHLMADWQMRIAQTHGANEMFYNFLVLLEKGHKEQLSITELAREAGMCERSFRNAVHAATGLSPKAYILKNEMVAAMELLRTTNMTVTEIAYHFQYSSPFYFSRVFKRYYGISPQQVRTKQK